jgi:hypothetical protein
LANVQNSFSCRGLVLLNIMTFVMGTNWVVLKESNEAFDPVRQLTQQQQQR